MTVAARIRERPGRRRRFVAAVEKGPEVQTGRRLEAIRTALERELDASHVEIVDDSARHAQHPGAAAGGGHFHVVVVSERFAGLSPVAAHRLVYGALGALMATEIHALTISALTPEQWRHGGGGPPG